MISYTQIKHRVNADDCVIVKTISNSTHNEDVPDSVLFLFSSFCNRSETCQMFIYCKNTVNMAFSNERASLYYIY